jgi:predicted P-loop ATPase
VEAARDALWARALQQYRAGICWHTVGDDFKSKLRERNEDHTVTDPWADQVADHLDFRRNAGSLPVAIPELMDLLRLDSSQRNNSIAVRLIELAGCLGWVKGRRRPAHGMEPRQGLWPKDWK